MSVLAEYEAQLLSEYATMAATLDQMANSAQQLSNAQPFLLEKLRPLERKMGLVLTLFKASMWAVLVQREEQQEEEEEQRR